MNFLLVQRVWLRIAQPLASAVGDVRGLVRHLLSEPVQRIAAKTTLLYLLFYPRSSDWLRYSLLVLGGVGLLNEQLWQRRWFWLAVCACSAARLDWSADNHLYLFTYWCLAIALAVGASEQGAALTSSSRLLLAGAFVLAGVWKGVLSSDYLDGRFFTLTLLLDPRFEAVTVFIANVPPSAIEFARYAFGRAQFGLESPLPLPISARLEWVSLLMTWWTVIIECLVGVMYLLPQRFQVSKLRDWCLLAFIWTTYSVAPVIGFGWVLTILGLTQARTAATRLAFFATFAILLAYTVARPLEVLGGNLAQDYNSAEVFRDQFVDPSLSGASP